MYVSDLREEFFDVLRGAKKKKNGMAGSGEGPQRVLILVHLDVDSLCAAKILLALLRCDQVPYTLVPVSGRSGLIRAFRDNVSAALEAGAALRHVLLLNCGATVDLVQDLALDDEEDELHEHLRRLVIFVADSHRPVDVCNVYNDGQVRLLMRQEQEEAVPQYEDIFRDSDSEDEDEEDEDGSGGEEDGDGERSQRRKRKRFDETAILKRRERRLWDDKRNKILFEYQQFGFFGEPTALQVGGSFSCCKVGWAVVLRLLFFQMYELAWKLSRDSNELLWLAAVAAAEQHLFLKSDDRRHLEQTERLRNHVARLNNRVDTESRAVNCLKLSFDSELGLALYRHWSIYESLQVMLQHERLIRQKHNSFSFCFAA